MSKRNILLPLVGSILLVGNHGLFCIRGAEAPANTPWVAPDRAARRKNPVPADTKSLTQGKELYVAACVPCHGATGKGDGPAGTTLERNGAPIHPGNLSDPKLWEESDGAIFWKLTEGRTPMPSWGETLSEEQRWLIINYVRTLAPKPDSQSPQVARQTAAGTSSASAQGQTVAAADISGTITLEGTPPPEKEIPQIRDDPTCGKLHLEPAKTRFYVVGPKGELADVFVTLKGISSKSTGVSAPPAVLDQRNCEYVPYVLAIQTNQKLQVKNSDPVVHNIHPTPAAPGNKEENRAQVAGGPDLTFTFPTAETFLRLKCDVHPWMFAYVSVVDHPYFAVSDKDGKYTIKNVPPGKYTIQLYHRKAAPASAPLTKEVEVKGGNVIVDFTLQAQ